MTSESKLRIAFMGTPDFAVPALRTLVEAGHKVIAAYSQTPKPAGRGQQIQKSPVHKTAEELGIEVRTPKTLRDTDEQRKFDELKLDAAVVVAYGLILPQAFLDAPRLGCLNIHFSLLPRWRGAAPVARALLAGDKETGVSIMQMAAGLDTGDVLLEKAIPITSDATSVSLLTELADIGASMTLQALEGLDKKTLKPRPQSEAGITYAAKLTKADGHIDWKKPAIEIDRQIRALQPWPGCFFLLHNEPVKVLAAELVPDKSGVPGTLLDEQFTVACGDQAIRLIRLQRSGKNATDGVSFLRGLRLPVGHIL